MADILSQISSMKTSTAIAEQKSKEAAAAKGELKNDTTDPDMFLKLMLKQMEHQDPTEPTDNSQWLAQLAQYSTLESMNNLNDSFGNVSKELATLNDSLISSNAISQTLSLVGKDVTLNVPVIDSTDSDGNPIYAVDEDGNIKMEKVSGQVEEASFKGSEGMIKVNGKDYSIGYVDTVKNPS